MFRQVFSIPDSMKCLRAFIDLNGLMVEAAESENSPWTRIGYARFANGGQRRHQQLVTVWLPRDQTAFPNLPPYISSLMGPASSEVQNVGMFIDRRTHASQPIMVQSSARYVQIGVQLRGELIPDLMPGGILSFNSGWKPE